MLREQIISDKGIVIRDKVKVSIERMQAFEPPEGYWLAFSGGKDSVTLKALADMAGVKYEAHYSITTVDPPELVQFIKTFPDVKRDQPKETMWELIIRNGMPPTRLARYCCKELKESDGIGRVTLTGVRWAESLNRKKSRNLVNIGDKKSGIVYNNDNDEARRQVESCYRTKKTLVNPIIDWEDDDVWEFVRKYKISYCKLYDEGWDRLGCIGCPMAGKGREKEFKRWPKYKEQYIRTFDRMILKRKEQGKTNKTEFTDGKACFDWWMQEKNQDKEYDDQIGMEEQ